jgi:hypothetical protein
MAVARASTTATRKSGGPGFDFLNAAAPGFHTWKAMRKGGVVRLGAVVLVVAVVGEEEEEKEEERVAVAMLPSPIAQSSAVGLYQGMSARAR